MTTVLLDPSSEAIPAERVRPDRLTELAGKTIGLLDIVKARGDVFLDQLEERLVERAGHVIPRVVSHRGELGEPVVQRRREQHHAQPERRAVRAVV